MSAQSSLSLAIADVRRRIQRAGSKGLNEENTKATLLEPLLRALGWDIEDVDEVAREFRVKSRDKPVDYALLVLREPKLLVEAKGLGENLDDRRWANQIMGYAAVAGVEWIVLTDGNEYRIYNTHAAVRVEEKLFRSVRIGDEGELVESTLKLISKAELRTNRIEALWRGVGARVEQMTPAAHDRALAWTSHVVHALAYTLSHAIAAAEDDLLFAIHFGECGRTPLSMQNVRADFRVVFAKELSRVLVEREKAGCVGRRNV